MGLAKAALACTALSLLANRPAAAAIEHQYCIVGAGPAGVQLGHFLHHAGRDYAIFERNQRAGSFFEKFPRHRRLISLNKRKVREGHSAEFALRHDWNSLLDVRPEGNRTRPMTKRSMDLFPHADELAEYIHDFAEEQLGAIHYNTEVRNVRRPDSGTGFLVDLHRLAPASHIRMAVGSPSSAVETALCRELIVASGFWRPRGVKVRVDGAEHVEGYEDVPATGESFEGKSVIVLGLGNAALETAQELQKYAAETHVYARPRPLPEGGHGVRFAYQTHYVGDIRAGRTTILDTYLLKSLDSLDFTALEGPTRLVVLPCLGTRRAVWTLQKEDCWDEHCKQHFDHGGQNLNYRLPVATWAVGSRTERRVKGLLRQHAPEEEGRGWKVSALSLEDGVEDEELEKNESAKIAWLEKRRLMGISEEVFSGEYEELIVSSVLLRSNRELLDALVPIRAKNTMDNLRYPMDHVIRCFGWVMDQSIFDGSIRVNTTHKGKYPELKPTFESVNVPGLYFAGTLAHGLDFRKSAGGFVHGFRYTARALFRLLEQRNFGVPWPSTVLSLRAGAGGLGALAERLLRRINEASGPYQMFGSLGDIVLFERKDGGEGWTARYLEEVPLAHAHEEYSDMPRLMWTYRYGEGFHGPVVLGSNRVGSTSSKTAEKSKFLHPHLAFFPAGEANASMRHWMFEDIFTSWDSDEVYMPMARFVARVVASATGDPSMVDDASILRGGADDGDEGDEAEEAFCSALGGSSRGSRRASVAA